MSPLFSPRCEDDGIEAAEPVGLAMGIRRIRDPSAGLNPQLVTIARLRGAIRTPVPRPHLTEGDSRFAPLLKVS